MHMNEKASNARLIAAIMALTMVACAVTALVSSEGSDAAGNNAQLSNALDYDYDPGYAYTGSISLNGTDVIVSGFTTEDFNGDETTANATADLARYLGALYRANMTGGTPQVASISFDGTTYTWDPEGTLIGSNWMNNGTTLTSAVVAKYLQMVAGAPSGACGGYLAMSMGLTDGTSVQFTYGIVIGSSVMAESGGFYYPTLKSAIDSVPQNGSTPTTIVLLKDASGTGIKTDGENVIIDFNGHTYNVTTPVGSEGTETQGAQLKKGSTVVFRNGTLASDTALWMINNYGDLTLDDMVIDGSLLQPGWVEINGVSTVSNYITVNTNCGRVTITGDTVIKEKVNTVDDGRECYGITVNHWDNTSYGDTGTSVTLDEGFTGSIGHVNLTYEPGNYNGTGTAEFIVDSTDVSLDAIDIDYGSVYINGSAIIGERLYVGTGAALVNSGTIVNNGTIVNSGSVENNGTIVNNGSMTGTEIGGTVIDNTRDEPFQVDSADGIGQAFDSGATNVEYTGAVESATRIPEVPSGSTLTIAASGGSVANPNGGRGFTVAEGGAIGFSGIAAASTFTVNGPDGSKVEFVGITGTGIKVTGGSSNIEGSFGTDSSGSITVTGESRLTGDVVLGDGVSLTVVKGTSLEIPSGMTLTVGRNSMLVNDGTIYNYGTISNGGAFLNDGHVGGTGVVDSMSGYISGSGTIDNEVIQSDWSGDDDYPVTAPEQPESNDDSEIAVIVAAAAAAAVLMCVFVLMGRGKI